MANEFDKKDSVFAFVEETTEGTAKAPASATDGYTQLREDGVEIIPDQDVLERTLITGTLDKSTPQVGIRSATGTFVTEFKASGTEGGEPDYTVVIESLLGSKSAMTSSVTTKATGNTGTTLEIEDADISEFIVGRGIVIEESGAFDAAVVTVVDTTGGAAKITISPAKASGVYSNSVVISKSVTYITADTGHPSFTFSAFWGNVVRQRAIGCRSTSMSLDSFETGQLASLGWAFQAMSHDETASSVAPQTPTYDTALPPVILDACVVKDGVELDVNSLAVTIEQTWTPLKSTCDADGVIAQRATGKRNITGSFSPYSDSTDVSEFADWVAGTQFELIFSAFVPASTTGEFTLGTVIIGYLPLCFRTKVKYGDEEGVMTDMIEFMATGGKTGETGSVTLSFI